MLARYSLGPHLDPRNNPTRQLNSLLERGYDVIFARLPEARKPLEYDGYPSIGTHAIESWEAIRAAADSSHLFLQKWKSRTRVHWVVEEQVQYKLSRLS